MHRPALLVVALVLAMLASSSIAARSAIADTFKLNKKAIQKDPLAKDGIDGQLDGVSGKKVLYHKEDNVGFIPPSKPKWQKGAFGLGQLGPPPTNRSFPIEHLDSVTFDGKNDWLSVTMKNGDFIRGKAESLAKGTLRLKNVEKPIRLMYVKEIVATEEPHQQKTE
jgi:hypothetical protein